MFITFKIQPFFSELPIKAQRILNKIPNYCLRWNHKNKKKDATLKSVTDMFDRISLFLSLTPFRPLFFLPPPPILILLFPLLLLELEPYRSIQKQTNIHSLNLLLTSSPSPSPLSSFHPNLHNAVSGRSCCMCFVQGWALALGWWAGSYMGTFSAGNCSQGRQSTAWGKGV